MNNEKFSDFSSVLSNPGKITRIYIRFVAAAFVISGIICAGLYLNAFGFIDRVNSYILADELMYSMIRSTAAAAFFTLLTDLLEKKFSGQ